MSTFSRTAIVLLISVTCISSPIVSANEVPTPRLDPNAPSLPENARDIDKLGFAASSLWWARAAHSIEDYVPPKSGKLDQVQLQLLEALDALNSVPDSQSDKLAKDQQDKRANVIYEVVKTAVEGAVKREGAKIKISPAEGLKEGAKEVLKTVVEPTQLGDGQAPTREALKAWIANTLYAYVTKDADKTDPFAALQGIGQEYSRPTTLQQGPPSDADFKKMIQDAENARRAVAKEKDRQNAAKLKAVQQFVNQKQAVITNQQISDARLAQATRSMDRPPPSIVLQLGDGSRGPQYRLYWQAEPIIP